MFLEARSKELGCDGESLFGCVIDVNHQIYNFKQRPCLVTRLRKQVFCKGSVELADKKNLAFGATREGELKIAIFAEQPMGACF